jgi:hypothetical protein
MDGPESSEILKKDDDLTTNAPIAMKREGGKAKAPLSWGGARP